jgi:hypothetical protein
MDGGEVKLVPLTVLIQNLEFFADPAKSTVLFLRNPAADKLEILARFIVALLVLCLALLLCLLMVPSMPSEARLALYMVQGFSLAFILYNLHAEQRLLLIIGPWMAQSLLLKVVVVALVVAQLALHRGLELSLNVRAAMVEYDKTVEAVFRYFFRHAFWGLPTGSKYLEDEEHHLAQVCFKMFSTTPDFWRKGSNFNLCRYVA